MIERTGNNDNSNDKYYAPLSSRRKSELDDIEGIWMILFIVVLSVTSIIRN